MALKRLRIYERSPTGERAKNVSQSLLSKASWILRRSNPEAFRREALLSQCLVHVNIHALLGVDSDTFKHGLCLVSLWLPNGNILEFLANVEGMGLPILRDQLVCLVFPCGNVGLTLALKLKGILSGLEFLHGNDIIHGDLRCVCTFILRGVA